VLDRPEPYEAHMHRATRTVHESNCWVMRLKAIANPGQQTRRLAMALRPPRETAQTTPSPSRFRPRRG
jgi:hypothetical protein